jgi:hypothetical protein
MRARAPFAGPGALRGLRRGRRGVVALVLERGAYVRLGSHWLFIAQPEVPFGPLSLAVVELQWDELRPGQAVHAEPGRLLLGDQAVSLERLRERRPPVATRAVRGAAATTFAAAAAAVDVAGAPPRRLAAGLLALRRGQVRDGVRRLAGRGDGLTPAGDDVLAGYAAWRHSIGAPAPVSALAADRSSPLGRAYLRCAERGELPDAGAALLAALRGGDPRAAASAALALRGWGASSGSALVWGICAATEPLEAQRRYQRGETFGGGPSRARATSTVGSLRAT